MDFSSLKSFSASLNFQTLLRYTLVFVIIFLAGKFGQYIFFDWKTSPAILWPPTGIGVAILWLYGYRYALPIFLALLAVSFMGPTAYYFPGVITTPLSQVVGQMVGVYLLKRFAFKGTFTNISSVLVFFLSIILLAVVSPAVSTTVSYFSGTLNGNFFLAFSRIWAGYAFSCLILTPFIIAWSYQEEFKQKISLLEATFTGAFITVATYLLFWTRLPEQYGIIMFALFLMSVIWACLRFSFRIVTLSVVYVTVFGILGLFISPAPNIPLKTQVFAAELFFFLVVPIMYAYSALVKERQQHLEELKQALAKIELENANKSNFIAVLAHELRNPLAPIKTTLEVLKLQKIEPTIQPLIASAHTQVHTMRRLLDDLLDVTRVTQGKFNLKTETIPLLPLLQAIIEATKNFASEHGHTIVFEPKSLDSVWVTVDPVRFEQVVVNVINNAAKFTPAGGTINLVCNVIGESIELRVEDTGKGIEPENLDRIFESFLQIKDNQHSSSTGIGVGLALARQIIELHNGSIKAESKGLGKGSTFIITIPCVTSAAAAPTKKAEETIMLAPHTILIVDDNIPAAKALAQLLSMKGHTVQTAYSGTEALEIMGTLVPDVVLLDIGLPDMTGYDVAKNLRDNEYKGALIALSGYGQPDDKQQASEAGFDFHFTKPMAIDNFEAYLHSLKKKIATAT